jgi:alkanesulfonate monooxygenase SsuD/methylene tetrahydromethanopterin reductase-like flavin-dependent oxidoreductase (luciferase family)
MWMAAGSPDSIRQVAARGYNLLLDQFASFEAVGERIATFKAAVEARGRIFDPMDVGLARAYFVAKDRSDKAAALERRLEAQRRLAAISNPPGGKNKASIMAFSDTREASEESALYGTPDEIAGKLDRLRQLGVGYVLLNGGGPAIDSLRRFAREVMPAFAEDTRMRVVV